MQCFENWTGSAGWTVDQSLVQFSSSSGAEGMLNRLRTGWTSSWTIGPVNWPASLGWFSLFLPQPNTPNPLKGEAFNGLCFGPSDVGQILSFLIKTHMHKGIEPWTFSTRKGTVTIMLLMLAVQKMQIKNKLT